jgi:hypothetical protein
MQYLGYNSFVDAQAFEPRTSWSSLRGTMHVMVFRELAVCSAAAGGSRMRSRMYVIHKQVMTSLKRSRSIWFVCACSD